MQPTIKSLALAGILGLGLALGAALPASAHQHGRLKADRHALNVARRQDNNADTRQEREQAHSEKIAAKAAFDQQRLLVHSQKRQRFNAKHRAQAQRRAAAFASSPIPTDVYHAHF